MENNNLHVSKGKNAYVEPEKEVVTLYQFSSGDHWRCSFCDSENPNTTNKCEVCGNVRIEPQKTEEHVPEQNKTVKEEKTNVISNGHNVYEFKKGKLIVLICIVAIILTFVIIGKLSTYKYDSRSKIIADKLTTESTTQITTQATTKSTTQVTTEKTTQATTKATTQATTETTQMQPVDKLRNVPVQKEWVLGVVKANTDENDEITNKDVIEYGASIVYFHFKIMKGPINQELKIHVELKDSNTDEIQYYDFEDSFSADSYCWYSYGTNDGTAMERGTLEVNIYDKDSGTLLGNKKITIE